MIIIKDGYKEIGELILEVSKMVSEGKVNIFFYLTLFLSISFFISGILIHIKRTKMLKRVGNWSKLENGRIKIVTDASDEIDKIAAYSIIVSFFLFICSLVLFYEFMFLIISLIMFVFLPLGFVVCVMRVVYNLIVDLFKAFKNLEVIEKSERRKDDIDESLK